MFEDMRRANVTPLQRPRRAEAILLCVFDDFGPELVAGQGPNNNGPDLPAVRSPKGFVFLEFGDAHRDPIVLFTDSLAA